MQDIHDTGHGGFSGGGGGGRFFSGGDRRLRPDDNQPNHHQILKCPRCDSLNTKFCYYNNYNLSQPRYFCKSCRRYWTKGGVLRNVPVGGGCRKTKRSKESSADSGDAPGESKFSAQSSSSKSSSTRTAADAAAEEGSAPSDSAAAVAYGNFSDSRFFIVNPQPLVDSHPATDGQILSTEMGSFRSMMASSEEMMGFCMGGDINPTTSYGGPEQVNQPPPADDLKMQGMGRNEVLGAPLDWGSGGGGGGGGDQELFDLSAGADPAYWAQSQWTDNDQTLNHLP